MVFFTVLRKRWRQNFGISKFDSCDDKSAIHFVHPVLGHATTVNGHAKILVSSGSDLG